MLNLLLLLLRDMTPAVEEHKLACWEAPSQRRSQRDERRRPERCSIGVRAAFKITLELEENADIPAFLQALAMAKE